ncbi:MAG: response regulator transcription factor [Dorea sp.]|jgi:two-component system LytT family response regulator|nr:response regulator transcription factor [Dorea sp.]
MMYDGLVLLVDDQPLAAEDSAAALKHYVPGEQIIYVDNAADAMKALKERPVSLVFLDIEMPDMSGFALAAHLEAEHEGVPYVFLTGHADFAVESYEYEPVDFLTKPVDTARLGRTFERVEKKTSPSAGKVAVRTGQDYVLVAPKEISYICKEKRKIWIRLKDGREYQSAVSLDELEQIFGDYGFFRCHQSFLIPVGDIRQVSSSMFGQTYEASLEGDTVIPVSRSKYARLKEELKLLGIPFVKGVTSK